jgi:predicted nucleic acid-binding protein
VTGSTSTASSIVVDASALIRAFVGTQPEARRWLAQGVRMRALTWPAHLYVEVAHPLIRLARAGIIDATRAVEAFAEVRGLPARVSPPRRLEAAMAVALERGLTVYDAAYVVLAEALDAPLVTADRRLAAATEQAILLPG